MTKSGRGSMVKSIGNPIAKPWAKMMYGTGAERRQAGAEESLSTATARVLASTGTLAVTSDHFCELDGAIWDVTSNVPYHRRERDITLVRRNS